MNLEKFKTDTKLFGYLLMGLAFLAALVFLFVFGFAVIFFIVLIGWAILIFYYLRFLVKYNFTARIIAFVIAILITIGIFFWAYNSTMVKKNVSTKTSGPTLVACTSTADATLGTVDGITADLYSGSLDQVKGSPDPKDATNTKTFSIKSITDKTSKESFYFRMAPSQEGGSIKGYDELMEVCNQDNKGSSTYITKNTSPESGAVKDDTVMARWSYFHGGKYLLEPGEYRADGYVWSSKTKKWTLVKRVVGITVTE
jgi:hypothetical protein